MHRSIHFGLCIKFRENEIKALGFSWPCDSPERSTYNARYQTLSMDQNSFLHCLQLNVSCTGLWPGDHQDRMRRCFGLFLSAAIMTHRAPSPMWGLLASSTVGLFCQPSTEALIAPLWLSSWDDLLRVLQSVDLHCLLFLIYTLPWCTLSPCKVSNYNHTKFEMNHSENILTQAAAVVKIESYCS